MRGVACGRCIKYDTLTFTVMVEERKIERVVEEGAFKTVFCLQGLSLVLSRKSERIKAERYNP